jgi:hypothetical protein
MRRSLSLCLAVLLPVVALSCRAGSRDLSRFERATRPADAPVSLGRGVAPGTGAPAPVDTNKPNDPSAADSLPDGINGFSETELSFIIIQTDSLGRRPPTGRKLVNAIHTQCIPLNAHSNAEVAVAAARRHADRNQRVPFDSLTPVSMCGNLAWRLAMKLADSVPLQWRAEWAAWNLLHIRPSLRALALRTFDDDLSRALAAGDSASVREALGHFAAEMWVRAQARLERPLQAINDDEMAVHRLDAMVPPLIVLPPIPPTSKELGISEAEWTARLYTRLAELTPTPQRSQVLRLALAPWVAMRNWEALDSAATALQRIAPRDSGVVMASALSHFHRSGMRLAQLDRVDATFDSVVRLLPRPDSARYDGFDDVLTRDDDVWRYGFLPNTRLAIERRGWLVLDPMWSTPVNELRLARRARVAEADFLYANVANPGQSGSETASGRMHVRRGAPSPRWTFVRDVGVHREYVRVWDGLKQGIAITHAFDWWRAFSGGRQRAGLISHWDVVAVDPRDCPPPARKASECVEVQRARWTGVPFVGRMDTIDVMLARFRAPGDSVDLYVEGRVPLRSFPHRDTPYISLRTKITTSLFLRTPQGEPIYSAPVEEVLPRSNVIALTHAWRTRTGTGEIMHRVEALEPSRGAAARGVMQFTSDAALKIPVSGFGMSDVLVTGNAVEVRVPAQRWFDYRITPNAGVVLPKQRFSLLWEIYELTPGPDGRVRWKVEIQREQGARVITDDVRDALTAGNKASAKVVAAEPDASSLTYAREAPPRGVQVEHVKIPLPDNAAYGRHVVSVTVTDLVSGRQVSRSVGVRLLVPSLQKRVEVKGAPMPFGIPPYGR